MRKVRAFFFTLLCTHFVADGVSVDQRSLDGSPLPKISDEPMIVDNWLDEPSGKL